MKKFGTPTGAGPGSAKENVGLPADGAPPAVVVAGFLTLELPIAVDCPPPSPL